MADISVHTRIRIGYDTNILELEFNSNASVSCIFNVSTTLTLTTFAAIFNVYLIDSFFRILTMNNR